MQTFLVSVAIAPVVIAAYAYVGYPLLLLIAARMNRRISEISKDEYLPFVTITVPVYNGVAKIGQTLEALLEVDYPRDRIQMLVISDASTDGTDEEVERYASQGIDLLRMPSRVGKTAAENAALSFATGEIIVNVDSTILVPRHSLKALVGAFRDPTVGVASGRDVSVGSLDHTGTSAESTYTGYEMWLRDLETRVGSIIGASGCFYGIRRSIHAEALPLNLSWDFASPLVARKQGYRSVSVPEAICIVPRTTEIRTEIKRKVRTMARGLRTLLYMRALLNPLRYGSFALMLFSHKLLRWVPYLLLPLSFASLCVLAIGNPVARGVLAAATAAFVIGVIGIQTPRRPPPRALALASFAVAVVSAGLLAWWEAFKKTPMSTWEPTPRPRTQT